MTHALHLSEINHRVANSFQVMSALAALDAREFPDAAEPLARVSARLSAFALVHRILEPDPGGVLEIEGSAYLKALCVHLDAACLSPLGVTLTLAIEAGRLDARLCQQVGLIVTELVLNAVKHAFADRPDGRLEIGFACDGQGGCVAWVKDDGPGFDFESVSSARGLGIVHRLSRTLDGECGCQSSPSGTQVLVRIPRPAVTSPLAEGVQ
jgi:two-component sensor histidine kinase